MTLIILSTVITWLAVGIAGLYFVDAREESGKEDEAFLKLWRKRSNNSLASWSDKRMIWAFGLYEFFGALTGPMVLLKVCRSILRSFAIKLAS